jgi:hypothetical protein
VEEETDMSEQDRDPKTADRLRKDIDRGRAGDKTDYPDPAAAPLGTDAEAGGHPPTDEELRIARAAEIGGRSSEDDDDASAVDRSRGRPSSGEDDPA